MSVLRSSLTMLQAWLKAASIGRSFSESKRALIRMSPGTGGCCPEMSGTPAKRRPSKRPRSHRAVSSAGRGMTIFIRRPSPPPTWHLADFVFGNFSSFDGDIPLSVRPRPRPPPS